MSFEGAYLLSEHDIFLIDHLLSFSDMLLSFIAYRIAGNLNQTGNEPKASGKERYAVRATLDLGSCSVKMHLQPMRWKSESILMKGYGVRKIRTKKEGVP